MPDQLLPITRHECRPELNKVRAISEVRTRTNWREILFEKSFATMLFVAASYAALMRFLRVMLTTAGAICLLA